MKRYGIFEANEAAHRVIDQAKAIPAPRDKPNNWRDYLLLARVCLVNQGLILIERGHALIQFAERLSPAMTSRERADLAAALGITDHGDHMDVETYARIEQEWPAIATEGGMGYWPPQTPRQEGYQAGFNRDAEPCPYEPGHQAREWEQGRKGGASARAQVELDLGNCPVCGHAAHEGAVCQECDRDGDPCSCDRTEQTSATPDHGDGGGAIAPRLAYYCRG